MRKCITRITRALGALWLAGTAHAGTPFDLGGTDRPSKNAIITFDGSDVGYVNGLIGADIFYNSGIFGQNTISANIEAGVVWNGHEALTLSTYTFAGTGALGEVDRHATWVGSILGGLNYNNLVTQGTNSILEFGIAPLTYLTSGAIATEWVAPPDTSTPSYSSSFQTSQAAIYTTYKHFTDTTIAGSYPFLPFPQFFFGFDGKADVINSSWGFEDPAGIDDYTKTIDALARANPNTTFVVAAGNFPNPPTPANSVTGPASGYNVIAVGATQTTNTVFDFNTVADFSTRGPQDYYDPVNGLVAGVRAPVDIVAPGTTLAAAYYGGQTGGNGATLPNPEPAIPDTDLYNVGLAGTSFAAPIVSGGVALLDSTSKLIEAGYTFNDISVPSFAPTSRDARVIKAVLMNSADKLPGWDNGQHFDGSAGHVITTQSLDWSQGAGQINLTRAFFHYIDPNGTHDVPGNGGGNVAQNGFDLGALTLLGKNDYVLDGILDMGVTLDATLTWFRDRSVDDLNQIGTDSGQANFDLQIWSADFTMLLASSESLYNTSEHLHFLLPADGAYGIRVLYAGQLFGTPLLESYGLAWNVVDVVPEPAMAGLLVLLPLLSSRRRRSRVS